ncbi:telomere repeat-binding protein 1-like isoform X4 [Durio zibethinus]|uniref:Telomere repeat-binding protein 1-like isoform X4 n=1 Tax=Durio zibethinus TaxID=66656 RepID=A0A6P5Z0E6_DURZI|nr:telomere repeat-binding protein 1-like isoform X4 [Durio zibethinus]
MKTDRKQHLIKKLCNMKRQRVDQSIVPGLEDEATEVAHLLAEPKSEHVSRDGVLCFGKDNLEKHLKMEDFSCAFDYGWKINYGGLDSIHGQGGDDLKLEVLDGLLDEVDEVDDIHAAHDISGACEDFLLDIEFPEKHSVLDCGPREGSTLRNSSSESHSPGFSGSSNSAGGISESSIPTVQESNSKNGVLGNMELESDCEFSASESEDQHKRTKRSKTACDRRKHQTMWTLAEVIKLVDGIAQYGVGRWTDIKRLLFASSAYRTPVDLRDKWRNLLRSSSAHGHNRRELQVQNNVKHAVRPLPKPVVRRIRELATIHPYPRVRSSKISSVDYVPSSKQPTTKVAPVYSPARNLRGKNCC